MTPENPRGGTLLGHPPGDTCTKKKQILGRAGCFWGVFLGGVTLGCHLGGVTLGVSPDDDRQNQSRNGNQVDERSQINAKQHNQTYKHHTRPNNYFKRAGPIDQINTRNDNDETGG